VKPHVARRVLLAGLGQPTIWGWAVWACIYDRWQHCDPIMTVTTLPALKACYSKWPKVNKEK